MLCCADRTAPPTSFDMLVCSVVRNPCLRANVAKIVTVPASPVSSRNHPFRPFTLAFTNSACPSVLNGSVTPPSIG